MPPRSEKLKTPNVNSSENISSGTPLCQGVSVSNVMSKIDEHCSPSCGIVPKASSETYVLLPFRRPDTGEFNRTRVSYGGMRDHKFALGAVI